MQKTATSILYLQAALASKATLPLYSVFSQQNTLSMSTSGTEVKAVIVSCSRCVFVFGFYKLGAEISPLRQGEEQEAASG